MPRVTCDFCGLPFPVRAAVPDAHYFCCSGCALASRIPMNGDVLPVSRGLVIALALGFGLFNQVLFSVLGAAIIAQGREDVGMRLVAVGVVVGAALLVVNGVFLATTKSRHRSDVAAGVLAAGLSAWAITEGVSAGWVASAWPLLGANLWFAMWWSRGWLRRALVRRKSLTGT